MQYNTIQQSNDKVRRLWAHSRDPHISPKQIATGCPFWGFWKKILCKGATPYLLNIPSQKKTTQSLCHITFETQCLSEHNVFKKTCSTCVSISCMDATVYVGLLFHTSSLDVNMMMSTDVMLHTVMSCVDHRERGDDDHMMCVKNCVCC